jgi:hypothetical protein
MSSAGDPGQSVPARKGPAGPPAGAQQMLQAMLGAAAGVASTSEVADALTAHLGPGAERMEIVRQDVSAFEHVNLQAALEAYVAGPGRSHELHGVTGGDSTGLLGMTTPPPLEVLLEAGASTRFGPVGYVNRTCGPDETRPCVSKGLYLISNGDARLALWIYEERMGNLAGQTILQAVSADIADTRDLLAELSTLMVELNVYRGQVHALSSSATGGLTVQFLERAAADRDAVILPPGVLESLEEQTIGIGRLRDTLLAAGRHLKRGLLLYGPPGTG